MSATRGFVLSVAAVAALSTLGLRAASQATAVDPAAQYQLATELYESAHYREALGAYESATHADDEDLVTRARKGKVRSALRIAEFELALREAGLLNDGSAPGAEAETLLGDALWANGQFDEADEAYRKALDEAPGSTRARFGLARSLASHSRLPEALEEAATAAGQSPRDAEIHALIGLVYERLNRYEEAAAAFEEYVALLPPRAPREDNQMAALFQSKVRLLRSFKGRVPQQIEGDVARVHRIPFKLVDKKIVLQGRVNRTPVEFVLDTGSERTGLSDTTARRAGVGAITSTLTAGVGIPALRRLDMGRADLLEIGGLRMRNVPVAIRGAVRNALPRWQRESLSPLALGLSVVIDYTRREVVLARTLPASQADVVLPMRMNRLPMVRGMLNSTHPTYFVVDTGGELISISAETASALSMTPVRRSPLRVFGMSGIDTNAYLLPGVDVDFDEIEYRNVGLAVLNLRAPSVLLGFQVGGIVGHRFLSDYRVSMDMGRSELRLEKLAS
ncbi:MAG: aspartyl protease family protein [Acidobacteria bacterium]|nr:aspartyl protease family protein [Acidobacteriota bacterium]